MSSPVAAARASIPLTCGELLQGVDDAAGPVIVSLPVARAATTTVTLLDGGGVDVVPHRPRALRALRVALAMTGWHGGARALLDDAAPPGRGYGTSTADVAGVVAAAMAAAGVELADRALMRLCTAVEPSDGSPLRGLWALDHVAARRLRSLGDLPAGWFAVVVDPGIAVDTVGLHATAGPGAPLPPGEIARLADAIATRDLPALARVATESALRNDVRLPCAGLVPALQAADAAGAAGVCVAHSGSLAAVLCASAGEAVRAAEALRALGVPARVESLAAPGRQVAVLAIGPPEGAPSRLPRASVRGRATARSPAPPRRRRGAARIGGGRPRPR